MPSRLYHSTTTGRLGQAPDHSGQVVVYRIEADDRPVSFPHIRRDFYKIELLTQAQGILGYADQRVAIQQSALIFVNPLIPYSWERTAGREAGYVCLFRSDFVTAQLRTGPVADSPLFSVGVHPVVFPNPAAVGRLTNLFEQMLTEIASDYVHKDDLIRTYVQLLIHEGSKMAPAAPPYRSSTSAARISSLFMELLDRQFPIASPQHTLQLKNANEFSRRLGVHTNHLNKALKAVTHKTTTEHITEKLLGEAKALLRHSDWSVADISYALGFEHATNFASFFKKQTGWSPNQYRHQSRVNSYVLD